MAERSSTKTTRAFRTIGEASEELGLQPHVLRFWESKFSQIQPMKRGGGRRFYRPEDIEFIRGIKTLLHDEGHPIKDVQRLIKRNGAQSVVDLGRSVERAARERAVRDVELAPQRIRDSEVPVTVLPKAPTGDLHSSLIGKVSFATPDVDRAALKDALSRLDALRAKWDAYLTPREA